MSCNTNINNGMIAVPNSTLLVQALPKGSYLDVLLDNGSGSVSVSLTAQNGWNAGHVHAYISTDGIQLAQIPDSWLYNVDTEQYDFGTTGVMGQWVIPSLTGISAYLIADSAFVGLLVGTVVAGAPGVIPTTASTKTYVPPAGFSTGTNWTPANGLPNNPLYAYINLATGATCTLKIDTIAQTGIVIQYVQGGKFILPPGAINIYGVGNGSIGASIAYLVA